MLSRRQRAARVRRVVLTAIGLVLALVAAWYVKLDVIDVFAKGQTALQARQAYERQVGYDHHLLYLDLTMPAFARRLYLVDARHQKVVLQTWAGHPTAQGWLYGNGSRQATGQPPSCAGAFETGQASYAGAAVGTGSLSLALHGLDDHNRQATYHLVAGNPPWASTPNTYTVPEEDLRIVLAAAQRGAFLWVETGYR